MQILLSLRTYLKKPTKILFLFLICSTAPKPQMNGIYYDQFGDFSSKWKLVTVRYRQDTREMRFTYANDKAWDSLNKGASTFQEGSVFAKIGYKSGIDPAFTSSVVPSGARRFQYMVKDSKKYADTDGWGYALFNSEGELFEGDTKIASQSCHACHKLVPEKDYIFSEPIETSPLIFKMRATYSIEKNKSKISFEDLPLKDFTGLLLQKTKSSNSLKYKLFRVL